MTLTLVLFAVLVAIDAVGIALEIERRRLVRKVEEARLEQRRRRQQDPLRLRRRVIINLRNGSAVAGVLWTRAGGKLVLKDAVLHEHEQEVHVDGEIVIDAEMVTFVQVPPVSA